MPVNSRQHTSCEIDPERVELEMYMYDKRWICSLCKQELMTHCQCVDGMHRVTQFRATITYISLGMLPVSDDVISSRDSNLVNWPLLQVQGWEW
jgi:hypothetical protein